MRRQKGPSYSQCPGVPEINYYCSIKIRSRNICPRCERVKIIGKLIIKKKCLGVIAAGHYCAVRTRNGRCKSCQKMYEKHQNMFYNTKNEKIERWCLKCSRKFAAKNKFLRLCPNCRELVNYSIECSGISDTQYSILG